MADATDDGYSAAVAARLPGRIKELRERAGLPQAELARRLGVPQPRIAEWERGRYVPVWAVIVRLAHALGVTPDAFTAAPAMPAEKKSDNPG